tara:strand:- start:32 stop:391 length:360 start_codon:yes stop_codon:yes gene_type:complete
MTEQEETPDDWNRDDGGRFGPGNKGGPGRKPGTKVPSLKAALERAIVETLKGEGQEPRSILDALAQTALTMAKDGDFKFWKEIMDRIDGPVTQKVEQDQTIKVERMPTRSLEETEDGDP